MATRSPISRARAARYSEYEVFPPAPTKLTYFLPVTAASGSIFRKCHMGEVFHRSHDLSGGRLVFRSNEEGGVALLEHEEAVVCRVLVLLRHILDVLSLK